MVSGATDTELDALRERIESQMNFSDIGRVCFGGFGVLVVQVCLFITQVYNKKHLSVILIAQLLYACIN